MIQASKPALTDWTLFVVCVVVGGITWLVDQFLISAPEEKKPVRRWDQQDTDEPSSSSH